MDDRCRCGEVLRHAYESWICDRCGGDCCPECAEAGDRTITCTRCAAARPAAEAAA
jgi:hypothetical protein